MNKQLQQFEAAMWQIAVTEFIVGALITGLLFLMLYYAIRAGIRDGIRDAGSTRQAHGRTHRQPPPNNLPDMRAD